MARVTKRRTTVIGDGHRLSRREVKEANAARRRAGLFVRGEGKERRELSAEARTRKNHRERMRREYEHMLRAEGKL